MTDSNVYYTGRISARDGRALFTTDHFASREDAARAAFLARPSHNKCSTARNDSFDVRWHRRDEFDTPAKAASPAKDTPHGKPAPVAPAGEKRSFFLDFLLQ